MQARLSAGGYSRYLAGTSSAVASSLGETKRNDRCPVDDDVWPSCAEATWTMRCSNVHRSAYCLIVTLPFDVLAVYQSAIARQVPFYFRLVVEAGRAAHCCMLRQCMYESEARLRALLLPLLRV